VACAPARRSQGVVPDPSSSTTSGDQRRGHNDYQESIITEGLKTIVSPIGDIVRAEALDCALLGVAPGRDEA